MWSKLQRYMQIQQIAAAATGLFLGFLLDVVSNVIGAAGWQFTAILFVLFLLSLAVYLWTWWRQPDFIALRLKPPEAIRLPEERKRVARRGIVIVMSLYTPQAPNPALTLKPEERLAKAKLLEYQALDFPHSNLAPIIEAILTHASRLEHCWLIGTVGTDRKSPGSRDYIPVLIEYFRQERNLQCQFHYGESLELSLDDDALVFDKMCKLMREIFQQAKGLGLQPADLIADCTSGIRSIALGAVLSSLDAERDIQLIGTQYAPDGKPFGALLPMIFHFEPVIQQE